MGDASDSSWGAALLDKLIASAAKRQSFDDMHVSEQAASLPPEMVLPFLATWADAGIAADDPASIEWLVRKAGWRSDQIKAVCFKVGIINFPKEAGQLENFRKALIDKVRNYARDMPLNNDVIGSDFAALSAQFLREWSTLPIEQSQRKKKPEQKSMSDNAQPVDEHKDNLARDASKSVAPRQSPRRKHTSSSSSLAEIAARLPDMNIRDYSESEDDEIEHDSMDRRTARSPLARSKRPTRREVIQVDSDSDEYETYADDDLPSDSDKIIKRKAKNLLYPGFLKLAYDRANGRTLYDVFESITRNYSPRVRKECLAWADALDKVDARDWNGVREIACRRIAMLQTGAKYGNWALAAELDTGDRDSFVPDDFMDAAMKAASRHASLLKASDANRSKKKNDPKGFKDKSNSFKGKTRKDNKGAKSSSKKKKDSIDSGSSQE